MSANLLVASTLTLTLNGGADRLRLPGHGRGHPRRAGVCRDEGSTPPAPAAS